MSDQPVHWLMRPNPLLTGIPTFADADEICSALSFFPLEGLDLSSLTQMQRVALLTCDKTPLCPGQQSLSAVLTWYGMLIGGLQNRNPLLAETRKQYWAVLNAAANGDPQALLKMPVQGISIHVSKGVTGTGKTVTARHFCRMLGPQYIDHGPIPEAGWNSLRQLVYLFADLSHDGSRGGFVMQLLVQMDNALGTSYASELPKRYRTVERLLVPLASKLIAHYTGIVFLDEGQLRNLVLSGQADLVQLMLIQLMNTGVPIVILGNERAFDWITYSQDQTRLNLNPITRFCPVGALSDPESDPEAAADAAALEQGILAYYVLPKPIFDVAECGRLVRTLGGGIARVGLTLFCSAQFNAITAGRDQLTPSDIQQAYDSPSFDDLRPLADGFAKRLPEYLVAYPDVDADFYAIAWGKPIAPSLAGQQTLTGKETPDSKYKPSGTESVRKPRKPSGPGKLKAEKKRNEAKQAARDALTATLSEEDMRRNGMTAVHLKGLNAARERIESERT